MQLPNFLIVGGQKCGSTTLHNVLVEHPEIFMSEQKEINFFTLDEKYHRGVSAYAKHFEAAKSEIMIGESSPGYMVHSEVPARILEKLGPVKIVIILRNPIKRALSQYWDNRRQLKESLELSQVIDRFLSDDYQPGVRGYFSRGVYMKYIERYEMLFGSDNIHVMIMEELIKKPQVTLQQLYQFLGVDTQVGLQTLPAAYNASTVWKNPFYQLLFNYPALTSFLPKRGRSLLFFGKQEPYKYQALSGAELRKLEDFYSGWNMKLEQYLGRELSSWQRTF